MKLDGLLQNLENVRLQSEAGSLKEFGEGYTALVILQLLVDFIGNKKIQEKIDEISF